MNVKEPSERKTVLLKTYVSEWMAEMAEALSKEMGGMARFLRHQIKIAWQTRHGEVVMVPAVGGPRPSWVLTSAFDDEGKSIPQDFWDNLVAVPHAELAHMREMHAFYESACREAFAEAALLRWALDQMTGGPEATKDLLQRVRNAKRSSNP